MEYSVIFSGFGGQGALFAGQMLAYAAMEAGMEVTWYPSYGPEMRGGTAHCTVIVADEEVGSPVVRYPDAVVAMNLPSANKYEGLVKAGGVLLWDSTLVNRALQREDVHLIAIPANEMAARHGDVRLVNVAMLGALCVAMEWVSPEAVEAALRAHLPARHAHLLEPNVAALREGVAWGRAARATPAA